jgi:hypothetical protein
MRSNFIELARICIAHSRVTTNSEAAAKLGRIAKKYRKEAADLEWENWPTDGEENVGNVLQEEYGRSAATCNQRRLHHGTIVPQFQVSLPDTTNFCMHRSAKSSATSQLDSGNVRLQEN